MTILKYTIEGTVSLPEGTERTGAENQFRLPDGKLISIQPVVEIRSTEDSDDHRNLTYKEAEAIGLDLEDYGRWSQLI